MGFWFTLLLWAAVTAVGELLRPKPKVGAPQPSSLGDFTVPTAEEGRAIPVAWGTVHLKGPNVTWFGDLQVVPITQKQKTGLFSSTRVITGYRYYLGLQLGLCHGPIDELLEVRFDDRSVPGSTITVVDGKNVVKFRQGNDVPIFATVPVGSYSTLESLAAAAETAMRTASGGSGNYVVYGFEIRAPHNLVTYQVDVGGVPDSQATTMPAGVYGSGQELANAWAAAVNAKEAIVGGGARIEVTGTYTGARFSFTAVPKKAGITGWHVAVPVVGDRDDSVLPVLGFAPQEDVAAATMPGTCTSPYPHQPKRFVFASISGIGGFPFRLMLQDADFTAAGLFGLPTGAELSGRNIEASQDLDLHGIVVTQTTDQFTIAINQPSLFGGDEREGGIAGTIDLYRGTLTQDPNAYLEAVLGVSLPGYRGVCYAVCRGGLNLGAARSILIGPSAAQVRSGMYVGTSPFIKNISFVLRRTPNPIGLTAGRENVGGDANPACVLYEILTDQRWGAGIPASLVYTASFVAAGEALFAEGLGVSMVADSQASAYDLVAEVLRHVDGVIYADPSSGLLTLKLARADYHVPSLPVLDPSSIESCRISRPAWDELKNSVKVHYVDRSANFTERVAAVQDLAQLEARGGEVSEEEYSFRGLSNAAAAQAKAAGLLKTNSYPLAPLELVVNRRAARLRPGDAFRLTWPPDGISDMVARATRVRDGEPRDGRVVVDAVEDVFAVDWTGYDPPAPSEWVDPVGAPQQLGAAALLECPYALVVGPERLALSLGARAAAGGLLLGYQVWSDPTGGTDLALTNEVRELTPTGLLSGGLDYTGGTFRLMSPVGVAALEAANNQDFAAGRNLVLIDQEFIAWQGIAQNADGSFTITGCVRGVADTTPALHGDQARCWFVTGGAGLVTNGAYQADVLVRAKLLAFNSVGVVELGDAPLLSLQLASRAARPYVPTAILVNGASYPSVVSGALTVSWSHRNRLGEWGYDDAGATASPEPGTTYTLRLYGEDGLLKQTYSGITGTSQAWSTEVADSGLGRLNNVLRMELESVVSGVVSYQVFNFTVWRDVVAPLLGMGIARPVLSKRRGQRLARAVSSQLSTQPGE